MFRSWAIPGLMIVLVSVACAEDSSAPTELAPNDLRASLNASTTPSKRPSWNERSTEAIWDYIVQSDTTVIVGLATPGKRHGVIQGEPALSRAEWNTARDFVRRLPVLVPLKEDTFLPAMLLKLKTRQALDLLRGNKFIDYVDRLYIAHQRAIASGQMKAQVAVTIPRGRARESVCRAETSCLGTTNTGRCRWSMPGDGARVTA